MKGENIFLVGDKITLADLALATFLSIGTIVGKYPLGRFQLSEPTVLNAIWNTTISVSTVGEIMKDERFPKLAKSLKEVQKLPEWSAIEKVMQEYVAAADSASGN